MAANDSIINLAHVTKVVDKNPIVNDLSFSVAKGQIFGLIGPSGGGKTSTVRLMVGIYAPTEGEVTVFGTPPTNLSLRQRRLIGYMPQHFFLHPTLTAKENLDYIAGIYGIGWLARRRLIRDLLKHMELWEARNRLASGLSGGMLRRLQLAAVMMHNPALVFVDEPMAGLDPLLRERMWSTLEELRDRGSTVVITTQITQEAERCDSLALIKGGRLIAFGTPEELREKALGGTAVRLLVDGDGLTPEAMSVLWGAAGVKEVTRTGANSIRVVTNNGSVDNVVKAAERRGVQVHAVEKATTSFDEVFERLVLDD